MKRLRVLKRPIAGSSKDKRSNGRWLWVALSVGKGSEGYTHANKKKRIAFRFLLPSQAAFDERPRGCQELAKTLKAHVRKGSFLVYDSWPGTIAAVKKMGHHHVDPVNHKVSFRDSETGFHTNDVESENQRIKAWNRHRYGQLKMEESDMHEYAFYVNKGSSMSDVMRGIAESQGGAFKQIML